MVHEFDTSVLDYKMTTDINNGAIFKVDKDLHPPHYSTAAIPNSCLEFTQSLHTNAVKENHLAPPTVKGIFPTVVGKGSYNSMVHNVV